MNWCAALFLFGAGCSLVIGFTEGRSTPDVSDKCTTLFRGCSLDKGVCVCDETVDCSNPYPYKDLIQCNKDIKGLLDKCRRDPCLHGQCVQAKHDLTRRWECSCAGSGFYGKKCEIKCPIYEKENLPVDYPSDCVY